MKVICIDDKHWHSDSKCPAFGEISTVEKSFASPSDGEQLVTEEFEEKYCVPVKSKSCA